MNRMQAADEFNLASYSAPPFGPNDLFLCCFVLCLMFTVICIMKNLSLKA